MALISSNAVPKWAVLISLLSIFACSSAVAEERSGWGRFFDRFQETFDDYPLHTAVRNGRLDDVQRHLTAGLDPNELDDDGYAPLHFAAWKGELEIASALIAAGATLEAHHPPYGETPLLIAIQSDEFELFEFLIEQGADYRLPNDVDQTPLIFAAQVGHKRALTHLLNLGVEPDDTPDYGSSPLFSAAANGHIECASILIEAGADLEGETWNGHTPIFAATYYGEPEMVQFLLDARGDFDSEYLNEQGLLINAVAMGHRGVVKVILEAGADPDWRYDHESLNALHLASKLGHRKIVGLLLDHGAQPNISNWRQMTPLHYATVGGHCQIIEGLIEQGADSGLVDEYGMTPDDFADLVVSSRGRELLPATGEFSHFEWRAVLPLYAFGNPRDGYPILSSGVAFAFGDRYVGTAAHCVDQFIQESTAESFYSPFVFSAHYGDFFELELLAVDQENDVAILRAGWDSHPSFELAETESLAGANELWVAGYPPPATECSCNTIPYQVYYEPLPVLSHNPARKSMSLAMGEGQHVGPGWSGSAILLPENGKVAGVFGRHQYELNEEDYFFHDLFGADVGPVHALLEEVVLTSGNPAAVKLNDEIATVEQSAEAIQAIIEFLRAEELGETDTAREALERFLDFRPESIGGNLQLAALAMAGLEEATADENLRREAEDRWLQSISLSPDSPLAKVGYASFLVLIHRYEEADSLLNEVEDAGVEARALRQLRLEILAETDPERAIDFCRSLEAQKAEKVEHHWFNLAGHLRDRGKYEEGLMAIERAAELAGNDAYMYHPRLANILTHLNRHHEAQEVYDNLLEEHPDNPYYWLWYSEFLADHPEGRKDEARRALMRIAEVDEYEMVDTEEMERILAKIEGETVLVKSKHK